MIAELCPWDELRRRPHITLAVVRLPDELGGGVYTRFVEGDALILLDDRLDDETARNVLAHEITHDETHDDVEAHSERFHALLDEWMERMHTADKTREEVAS